MMKVRTALVPVVNFTQNTWTIVLLFGPVYEHCRAHDPASIFFSFSVLFQLVTLPVEIDASRRLWRTSSRSGMSSKQVNGAKKVLTAAALTYVLQRSLRSFSCSTLWLATTETQPITNGQAGAAGFVSSRRCTTMLDLISHGPEPLCSITKRRLRGRLEPNR